MDKELEQGDKVYWEHDPNVRGVVLELISNAHVDLAIVKIRGVAEPKQIMQDECIKEEPHE